MLLSQFVCAICTAEPTTRDTPIWIIRLRSHIVLSQPERPFIAAFQELQGDSPKADPEDQISFEPDSQLEALGLPPMPQGILEGSGILQDLKPCYKAQGPSRKPYRTLKKAALLIFSNVRA